MSSLRTASSTLRRGVGRCVVGVRWASSSQGRDEQGLRLSKPGQRRLLRLAERTTTTVQETAEAEREAARLSDAWESKGLLHYVRQLEALSQRDGGAAERGPEVAAALYTAAVERLGSYGDVEVLEALVRSMDKDGIRPSGRLAANLVVALCRAGQTEAAKSTYAVAGGAMAPEERQRSVSTLLEHVLQAGGGRRSNEAFRSFAMSVLQESSASPGMRCTVAAALKDRRSFFDACEDLRRASPGDVPAGELQHCLQAAVQFKDKAVVQEILMMIKKVPNVRKNVLDSAFATAIYATEGDFATAKARFDNLRMALQERQSGARQPGNEVCRALLKAYCRWPMSTARGTIRLFDDLVKLAGPSESLVESIADYWQEREFTDQQAELIYATLYRAKSAGVNIRAERMIPVRNRSAAMLPPVAFQGVTVRIPPIANLRGEKMAGTSRIRSSRQAHSLSARLLLLCAEELALGQHRSRAMLARVVAEISSSCLELTRPEFGLLSSIFAQVGAWRAFHELVKEMATQGLSPSNAEFCEGIKAFQAADALLDAGTPVSLTSEAVLASALDAEDWEASRELVEAGPERFEEEMLQVVHAILRTPGLPYNTAAADVHHALDFANRLHLQISDDTLQEVERLKEEAWARENEWTPALEDGDSAPAPAPAQSSTLGSMGAHLNWRALLKETA